MLYTRYAYAAGFCDDKDVLEVACGAGHGLAFLARRAHRIVGGDYTESLVQQARAHCSSKVPLLRLDAQALPFRDRTFDVVILYEAIYYLEKPDTFLRESQRVLRDDGVLLICSANREWAGFNRSPFAHRYFSAREIRALLTENQFEAELFGAFAVQDSSATARLVSGIRRFAVRFHLIPNTMKGKEFLKRLFYGNLQVMGPEVEENMAKPAMLFPIKGNQPVTEFKILYAVARPMSTNSPT